jgi:hypothetical protein
METSLLLIASPKLCPKNFIAQGFPSNQVYLSHYVRESQNDYRYKLSLLLPGMISVVFEDYDIPP